MAHYDRNFWSLEVISKQADEAIKSLVEELGLKKWTKIARILEEKNVIEGRTGKQCRERWFNHLDPNIKNEGWSIEEEQTLFECQLKYGNCWSKMVKHLPGRTDNAIKNYFYSTLRRNLRRYNKRVPESDQLHGNIQNLIMDPKILKMLSVHSERKRTKEEKELEKQIRENSFKRESSLKTTDSLKKSDSLKHSDSLKRKESIKAEESPIIVDDIKREDDEEYNLMKANYSNRHDSLKKPDSLKKSDSLKKTDSLKKSDSLKKIKKSAPDSEKESPNSYETKSRVIFEQTNDTIQKPSIIVSVPVTRSHKKKIEEEQEIESASLLHSISQLIQSNHLDVIKTNDPSKNLFQIKDSPVPFVNHFDPFDPQNQQPFNSEDFGYHKLDSASSFGRGDPLSFLNQDGPFSPYFPLPAKEGSEPEGFRFTKLPSLGDDYMFQPENYKYMKISSVGEENNFNPENFKLMRIPSAGEESNFQPDFKFTKLPSLSNEDCALPPFQPNDNFQHINGFQFMNQN